MAEVVGPMNRRVWAGFDAGFGKSKNDQRIGGEDDPLWSISLTRPSDRRAGYPTASTRRSRRALIPGSGTP